MTRALGRAVVSGDDASTIGSVRAMVVDKAGRRIEALHVNGRARRAQLLDWDDIAGFGPDAVVTRPAVTLHEVVDHLQEEMVRGRITVLGGRVLGADGFERGRVDDVAFDPRSGELSELAVGSLRIPARAVRGLGHYCWVVDESVPLA
jgi:uncharacterized protein YrrD